MKTSFRIAEINFGSSAWDVQHRFEYKGAHFEVSRFGANYSVTNVKNLISSLQADVDVFAMTSLPPTPCLRNQSYIHHTYFDIMNTPSSVPLCDGTGLKEILNIQSLETAFEKGRLARESQFYFPASLTCTEIEEYIRHQPGSRVRFGDLSLITGLPLVVRPFPGLMTLATTSLNLASRRSIRRNSSSPVVRIQKQTLELMRQQIEDCRYVVADLALLHYMGDQPKIFENKEVITWSLHAGLEKHLRAYNFKSLISLFPVRYQISPFMNYALLECTLRLAHQRFASLNFEDWQELLQVDPQTIQSVKKYALARSDSTQVRLSKTLRKVQSLATREKEPDFAFIVHALSHRDFERVPVVGPMIRQIPKAYHKDFDQVVSKLPPIRFGRVRNVVSQKTGKTVNGLIYALWATPQVLKNQDPEITYAQIQHCCRDAADRGAKIVGLGAYTKIVGDSGVTINKNSPLPVTTGNSLSASATLWGLYDVVKRMNLLSFDPDSGKVKGTAMVIGATGSIGRVSAKLLALVFKKLIIVAPRMERLEELARELRQMAPQCEVICATQADEWASQVDALVTATSALDHKVVDVMKLKPGCVVCDCSRPLDFTKEDAQKRPDLIIMESGELVLPGPYDLTCDLGLPGNTVYACLAETAVLALEERYESFTLGRDIDWVKVKEIYKLCQKHGVQLASIQGHMGTLTDREIALVSDRVRSLRGGRS
ncbi:MAG: dehydrogenase [Bdellovibrionales bacterium]